MPRACSLDPVPLFSPDALDEEGAVEEEAAASPMSDSVGSSSCSLSF